MRDIAMLEGGEEVTLTQSAINLEDLVGRFLEQAQQTGSLATRRRTGSDDDRRTVVHSLRYHGYLARHRREIERVQRLREVEIPEALDPAAVPGLSREIIEQLERHRPSTLADAEGLPGMTPAAVAILAGRIARWGRRR